MSDTPLPATPTTLEGKQVDQENPERQSQSWVEGKPALSNDDPDNALVKHDRNFRTNETDNVNPPQENADPEPIYHGRFRIEAVHEDEAGRVTLHLEKPRAHEDPVGSGTDKRKVQFDSAREVGTVRKGQWVNLTEVPPKKRSVFRLTVVPLGVVQNT